MSKPVLLAILAPCVLSAVFIAPAPAWDEPIWTEDGLQYPEGADIPAWLTDVERAYLEKYPLQAGSRSGPPTGPIYCVPEYDPMEGLLLSWESYSTIQRQMIDEITTTGDAIVYIVVDDTGEQSSVASTLAADGIDMSRVKFVVRRTDTVWIRDYGPRYIYEGNCRAIIDHTYNRARPNDNAFNSYFKTYKNHALYEIPLVHGGGNFHLNGLGEGHTSRLIIYENPDLTEQQIFDLWLAYQNLETTFWTPLPSYIDSTQHIDMWMQIVADDVIIISDWPADSGSTQDQICDNAAATFASWGWTVHRTPARRVSYTHYTYTNMVLCNDLVLLPSYTHYSVSPYNDEALAACQAAMPDKTVVPINCESIIGAAGAMHCIVMHVPMPPGGENPTTYLKNYRGGEVLEPGTEITINWISDDDQAVADVDILLSTDGGATFPTEIVSGTAADGEYAWTVPDIYSTHARLRVVVNDHDGHSGYDQSDTDLTINGEPDCPADLNGDGVVDLADLSQLLASYDQCAGDPYYDPAADLDGDDCVNLADLALLLSVYGTDCP